MAALEKAVITNKDTGVRHWIMFNPEEYTLNRENNFAQVPIPGLSAPLLQFVHGNLKTLDMELSLDTLEEVRRSTTTVAAAHSDVRDQARAITGLMDINPATHAPPVLEFSWGSLQFLCVLGRCSQKYTMFLPDGTPVRAKLQVTFQEYLNVDIEAKKVKRQTADYTKLHVVTMGDTLPLLAYQHYGDAAAWRPIAWRNGLDDPGHLPIGMRLAVPRLPYPDPDAPAPEAEGR